MRGLFAFETGVFLSLAIGRFLLGDPLHGATYACLFVANVYVLFRRQP